MSLNVDTNSNLAPYVYVNVDTKSCRSEYRLANFTEISVLVLIMVGIREYNDLYPTTPTKFSLILPQKITICVAHLGYLFHETNRTKCHFNLTNQKHCQGRV